MKEEKNGCSGCNCGCEENQEDNNETKEQKQNLKEENDAEIKIDDLEEIKKNMDEDLTPEEKRINELVEALQRNQAEFENYRKRVEKEKLNLIKAANKNLVKRLIPILNNIDLALANTKDVNEYANGTKMIFAQLFALMQEFGLKEINTKNCYFNPNLHEALMTVESEEDGKIVEEFQKGYMLNDIVLTPSKVKVSKKPKKKEENKESKE
jgi:molecular chaperone GrpE